MIHEQKRQITYGDIDANWDFSLTALLRLMSDASWASGEALGVGVSQIEKTGLAFTMQRMGIKIFGVPILGDEITIRTWADTIRRISFIRKGELLDSAGKKLIEWESLWVLYDITERKIKRPNALNQPIEKLGAKGVEIVTKKINLPTVSAIENYTYHVQFSDLDTYQNMRDTHYGDLISNVYMLEDSRTTFIKPGAEIQFNYSNEGQIDDIINIELFEHDDSLYVQGATGAQTLFKASIRIEA